MCAVRRNTFNACAAPNRNAPLPLQATPRAVPRPMAIRHAVSRAVIAAISEAPRTSVAIPTGVVKKNSAMSTSATTRLDVPARNPCKSKVVAGMSTAKANALYATSVNARLRHARQKSPVALVKSARTVFHIAVPLVLPDLEPGLG